MPGGTGPCGPTAACGPGADGRAPIAALAERLELGGELGLQRNAALTDAVKRVERGEAPARRENVADLRLGA